MKRLYLGQRAWLILFAALVPGVLATNSRAANVPAEFQPNYDEGYELGFPRGYKSGLVSGKERGRKEGWSTGFSSGKSDGWSDAFQPAYDLAYDAEYPLGHRAGWKDGLFEGFDAGRTWAPVVAEQVYNYYYGSGTYSGILSIDNSSNWSGSFVDFDFGVIVTMINPNYYLDATHYYDQGYSDGRTAGFSTGSEEGFNVTYPKAYAAAYPIGYVDGVWDGTRDGTRQGGQEGYDDGWDSGYDTGYDEGFYAGIDYELFGDFVLPKYVLDFTQRSDAFTRQTLLAVQAPEPASGVMLGVAGVLIAGAARRKRRG